MPYCGAQVAALCPSAERDDSDPLDICVVSERAINHSELIVPARVVSGLQILDRGEADDKIVAVLEGDLLWGEVHDIEDLPNILIERLQHYFSPTSLSPDANPQIAMQQIYGAAHAERVVEAAIADYSNLSPGAA